MTNMGEQPSVRKPHNEIATSCLTALLAMTGEGKGIPRNNKKVFLIMMGKGKGLFVIKNYPSNK